MLSGRFISESCNVFMKTGLDGPVKSDNDVYLFSVDSRLVV
jgi:hypothetical protein